MVSINFTEHTLGCTTNFAHIIDYRQQLLCCFLSWIFRSHILVYEQMKVLNSIMLMLKRASYIIPEGLIFVLLFI